jgi:hypothetical protein
MAKPVTIEVSRRALIGRIERALRKESRKLRADHRKFFSKAPYTIRSMIIEWIGSAAARAALEKKFDQLTAVADTP